MSIPARAAAGDPLVEAFAATLPFSLDDFQVEALQKLETHRGVLVSAPTSSGKTVVAEYAVWRALAAPAALRHPRGVPSHVIYTTPLKALSNQKFHDLRRRYREANVGLVTGEHTVNDGAPVVVMTTEILRNVIYDEPERLDRVGDVVLDEVHYIDDYPRGTVWEEVIVQAPKHIRFIGLSATISNVDEVAAWMTGLRGPVATVVRTERPVELKLWLAMNNELHPLFDARGHADRRTVEIAQNESIHTERMRYVRRAPDNDLLHVLEALRTAGMLPAIYFIFSRRGCREAVARCEIHGVDLTTEEEKLRIAALYEDRLVAIEDDDERRVFREAASERLLARGVAMHHAGMLPYAKETVEQLFLTGLVKVVFATETLSLGLNMPARACVLSSFTKFDGTGFHALTSAELTQLMGRAGRRGIDTLGHGVILKESDVDVHDIYDAAMGDEMSVLSKFAPTYTMTLNLLRNRTVEEAENLLERSFGQFQNLQRTEHWVHREQNLKERLEDLSARVYRHPRIRCTERTLVQFLREGIEIETVQARLRRARRENWRDSRRGRYGSRTADPGQRTEQMRRQLKDLQSRHAASPCRGCPHLADHRANHQEIRELRETLEGGEEELRRARERYRTEFHAFRAVLHEAGFLENDRPTALGTLAASLYGESALVVAQAIEGSWFDDLEPAELAATLVMLVAEDRGRDHGPVRRNFPTGRVEQGWRTLRTALHHLAVLEQRQHMETLRPLSLDYVTAAYHWTEGVPLAEIEPPAGADVGDVIKAVKNLYSMLRQVEQVTRTRPVHGLIAATRDRLERDLIRRI
ncbi:MAG: DEAD/DEAH box helicase [Chloroflexi bacterium]|nr:MAG: DEAD/DEAH box helicase [Chloroflexota bacterium]